MSDEREKSPRQYRGVLLAALSAFVAYNTFLPFRFYTVWSKIRRQIGEIEPIPFRHGHQWVSLTDILGNILLFIPIGAAAWYFFYGKKADKNKAVFWSLEYGFALSIFIEITQIFLRYRVTSIHDVLMNSLGALLGAWMAAHLYIRHGRRGWAYFVAHLKKYPEALAGLLLLLYILFYQLLPFDFSFNAHSFAMKSLNPFSWLSGRQRLEDFFMLGSMALALGILSGYPVKDSRLRHILTPALLLALFAATEALHLIMYSRALDVYRLLALGGGFVAGRRLTHGRERALKSALLINIVFAYAYPFDFVAGPLPELDRVLKMLTPFYYYYKTTSIWNLWDMAHALLNGGMIAYLIGPGRRGSVLSLMFIGLLESMQLFLRYRIPDITDVLMAATGVLVMRLLWQAENLQARKPLAKKRTDERAPASKA